MEIRKRFFNNIAVLYITHNIDIDSAALIEETGRLLKEGVGKILCNFANVNIIDYNGLSILSIAYKNVINQEGVMKFCDVPAHIKALFKSARLDTVFEMHADEENALESFALSAKVDRLTLRRRFKRIDANIPVKYKVGLSADGKLSRGKAPNISADGLFILSEHTHPASTHLYMEIGFDNKQKPLALMGSVIWLADRELQPHSYPGMGVEFINMEKRSQEKIIEFIDKNITQRSKT